jgi:hypothetical protein
LGGAQRNPTSTFWQSRLICEHEYFDKMNGRVLRSWCWVTLRSTQPTKLGTPKIKGHDDGRVLGFGVLLSRVEAI